MITKTLFLEVDPKVSYEYNISDHEDLEIDFEVTEYPYPYSSAANPVLVPHQTINLVHFTLACLQ